MSKLKIFLSFLFIFVLSTTFANATSIDKKFIEHFAKNAIKNSVTVPPFGTLDIDIADIDPRIIIHDCDKPLTVDLPEQTARRNINVKVRCEGSTPWQLYLAARITIKVPVIIAKTNIAKGSMLDDDNLIIENIDQSQIRGEVYNNLNDFIGAKTTRFISQNSPLNKHNICLVCKDDDVTISVKYQGLRIKTEGVAIANGVLGEDIPVKNKQSGKVISAKVMALNKVEVFL